MRDILLLAVCYASALLAIQMYHPVRKVTHMMNAAQMVLPLDGFFALERFPGSNFGFRWMQHQGTIELPNPGGVVEVRLTLNTTPARTTRVHLRVDTHDYSWDIAPTPRHYALIVPPSESALVRLTFDAQTQKINNRDLSMALSEVQVLGGSATPSIPLLLLAITALSGYGAIRLACSRPIPLVGIALVLSLAVGYLAGMWRLPIIFTLAVLWSWQCLLFISMRYIDTLAHSGLRALAVLGLGLALVGALTKLPMLASMMLIYTTVWQRKMGLAVATAGIIVAFAVLNSVLFIQYWAWLMAVLPLLVCEMVIDRPALRRAERTE